MANSKFVKGKCASTGKYFGLEVRDFGGVWKVVNMEDLPDSYAKLLMTEVAQERFETNGNLLPCSYCNTRTVSSCGCLKSRTSCTKSMPYNFDCTYCSDMKIDYSWPDAADGADEQGGSRRFQVKATKPITFSNVSWAKFDKVPVHAVARPQYDEPLEHVIANERNIEFHGYNISEMDEGVSYTIGQFDSFEIACNVDTSHISPHPGGHLYISLGILTAQITENGGSFLFNGRQVANVGSQFNMRLSLVAGGKYEVYINGNLAADTVERVTNDVKIVFGFKHDSHCCQQLSHAYIRDIQMRQISGSPRP